MASNNETVAEIMNKVHSGDYGCSKCGDSCDCPNADKIIAGIAERFDAAHRYEMDALVAHLGGDALAAKDAVIAELRRRLKVAEDALKYARNNITRDCYNECDHIRECTSAHGRCKCIVEEKVENALAAIREPVTDRNQLKGGSNGK